MKKERLPAHVSLGVLQARTPEEVVEAAAGVASTLADVIRKQNLAVRIQGREYVRVEGWTTLATMMGVVPREVSVEEKEGGRYVAVVELVRVSDGAVLTRASAECGPDEPRWKNMPRYARRSMAITRATSKACRIAFSFVMSLAGFEPTPAEEVEALQPQDVQVSDVPKPKDLPITEKQHRALEARIWEVATANSIDPDAFREFVREQVLPYAGVDHLDQIGQKIFSRLMDGGLERLAKRFKEEAAAEAEPEEKA